MAKLMGVINATPDSFYSKSCTPGPEEAIEKGLIFAQQGADILDVGGESSKPPQVYQSSRGECVEVSVEEEKKRILPVIVGLKQQTKCTISVDTRKAKVAAAALEAGADWINDITGFQDPEMIAVARDADCPICVMHMQGSFLTMQNKPHYPEGVVPHLLEWFDRQLAALEQAGINQARVILDPGIGFGKSVEDNLSILKSIEQFKHFGCPLLLGCSRKSFLKHTLQKETSELLPATLATSAYLMMKGIDILRVHDIEEHQDFRLVWNILSPLDDIS